MPDTDREQIGRDLRLCETLFSAERSNRSHWQEVMRLVMPELIDSADLQETHSKKERKRVCSHAQTNVLKLAAAHSAYITPMAQKWFQYAPWYEQELDEREWAEESSWYNKCTEIVHGELHKSNFYTEKNATDIDRCCAGSGLMLAEGDEQRPLSFVHVPIGTFAWAENAGHEIDTVVRKIKMTPAQLVDEFGEKEVGELILEDYRDEGKRYSPTAAREVYHLVEPRLEGLKAYDLLSGGEMPWRSVYIDVKGKTYLRRGGYYEFPYFATRFNRFGISPYGRSPLAGVLDDIKDWLALKHLMFLNAQKKTIPPILVTATIEGEVDPRAGGVTIVGASDAQMGMPREWATAGDIRDGLQQIADIEQKIDQATYVDVIQTITQTSKQMTATEVNALQSEQLLTFSPSFMQYVSDFRAMNVRIFCILARQKKINLADAPEGVVNRFLSPNGDKELEQVLPPDVSYIGKMAQTIQAAQQTSLKNMLQELVVLAKETGDPSWLDPINKERTARWLLNASSVPYRCTHTPDEVKKEQQRREAIQQAQLQAQVAEQQSVAERNMAQAAAR